jgi:hypothetical protein
MNALGLCAALALPAMLALCHQSATKTLVALHQFQAGCLAALVARSGRIACGHDHPLRRMTI